MNAPRPRLWDRTLRGRPELPAQLLDSTEEEYAERLRQFGFSEDAIEQEVGLFRQYTESLQAKTAGEPIHDGPTKGPLYAAWVRSFRGRRNREEGEGGEEQV